MSTISPSPAARSAATSRAQSVFAAELGIDPGRIDHVVAVHRARPRRGDRRRIDMADAEAREVGHERFGVRKGEALVELQPHGGARRHLRRSRRMARRRFASRRVRAPPRRAGRDGGASSDARRSCRARSAARPAPECPRSGSARAAPGDRAVKPIAASTAGAESSGRRRVAPADLAGLAECAPQRGTILRALLRFALLVRDEAERMRVSRYRRLATSPRRSANHAWSSSRPHRGAIWPARETIFLGAGTRARPCRRCRPWRAACGTPARPCRGPRRSPPRDGDAIRARAGAGDHRPDRRDKRRPARTRPAERARGAPGPSRDRCARRRHAPWRRARSR